VIIGAHRIAHAVGGSAGRHSIVAVAYVEAGADMIFAEALKTPRANTGSSPAGGDAVPVLANLTESGKTPLFTGRGAWVPWE